MDMITLAMAKNNTIEVLLKNGQIGGEKLVVSDFFPETTLTLTEGAYNAECGNSVDPNGEYTVTIDGVEHNAIPKTISGDGVTLTILGNPALAGAEENTGENYLVAAQDGVLMCIYAVDPQPETITLSITEKIVKYFPPHTTIDVDDIIGAYIRGEEPAKTLDKNRLNLFLEGFKKRNLEFTFHPETDRSAFVTVGDYSEYCGPTENQEGEVMLATTRISAFQAVTGRVARIHFVVTQFSDGTHSCACLTL